jgi:radical SAM protein with 4Fe4S-binding SPASM domain
MEPGTYKYDGMGALAGHRFHLRLDPGRKGVLLVDASRLVFANGTALDYLRGLLEGWDDEKVVHYMQQRYRHLDHGTAVKHLSRVRDQLLGFLSGDLEIIRQVASDTPTIGADELPSPYRMDLALTYRCQNNCVHCYNESRRAEELSGENWLRVVDKLWEIGIPHIVFTGGEPTLCPHLGDLIARSEEHGQITGLITNGRRLAEEGYLDQLIRLGLDHAQITLLSHKAGVHESLTRTPGSWKETVDGIKAAVEANLYLSTNTTITETNYGDVEDTIRFLIDLGVRNVAVNGLIRSGRGKEARGVSYKELEGVLTNLVVLAEERNVKLIWYTPTPYCDFNPINYGLGIKQCTACSLNMAIEPDGNVLPCQSYYQPLGNILADPWDGIWNHSLCRRLRAREYLLEKCQECNLRDVCGGGCPLSHDRQDYICTDRHSSI